MRQGANRKPTGPTEDPRVERSRRVVLLAALDELGAVGYGAFTIESVAARAGVGKSTIYRHWPDKLAVIADAFETFHVEMVPNVETGSVRERVTRLVRHVAEIVVDSTFSACIPALIEGAERDPRVRAFHHRYSAARRQSLIDILAEGVATGEVAAHLDPELAALALLGPIFYRRLMSSEPFDPAQASNLVDTVLGPAGVQKKAQKRPAHPPTTTPGSTVAT
jgi:AcrR family transcriptional regulator